ncbi:hypothetical protein [Clostridioides difficile]|uniref:hypothetical protein n=1 Tax=Clostridioides difficile TaxID=1496 RepID=UPI0010331111|nr:hypothetical protein [Clostridioides difficile]
MTEKLTDNASLRELMTALESIKNDLQINKSNIVNAIGSPATLSDKLSMIAPRIISVLTDKNNTISQLNSKYKVASGKTYELRDENSLAYLFDAAAYSPSYPQKPYYWIRVNSLGFTPDIFFAERQFFLNNTNSYYRKHFIFVINSVPYVTDKIGFVLNVVLTKARGNEKYTATGQIYKTDGGAVSTQSQNIYVPTSKTFSEEEVFDWCAIKFT